MSATQSSLGNLWLLLSLAPLACSVSEPKGGGTDGPEPDTSTGTPSGTTTTPSPPANTTDGGSTSGVDDTSSTTIATDTGESTTSDGENDDATTTDASTGSTGEPAEVSCADMASQYVTCGRIVPGYEDRYYTIYYDVCQQYLADAAMYSAACLIAAEEFFVCITALDCRSFLNDEEACLVELQTLDAACNF